MTRLGPGIYDDGHGTLHLDVPELLRAHGYAVTPENINTLGEMARQVAEQQYGIRVTVTPIPFRKEA
jgi:hypothetical protein